MSEQKEKRVDLQKVVMEVTAEFLKENRSEIIKRAHARIRAEHTTAEKKQKDA